MCASRAPFKLSWKVSKVAHTFFSLWYTAHVQPPAFKNRAQPSYSPRPIKTQWPLSVLLHSSVQVQSCSERFTEAIRPLAVCYWALRHGPSLRQIQPFVFINNMHSFVKHSWWFLVVWIGSGLSTFSRSLPFSLSFLSFGSLLESNDASGTLPWNIFSSAMTIWIVVAKALRLFQSELSDALLFLGNGTET
jgi:hypothetical protein